mgnify:FL=1
MSKPRTEVQEETYFRDIHFLYEIFNSLKSTQEIKLFLRDILTRSELRMIKRRWHVASLLMDPFGYDIRWVSRKSKTSTQTISRIKSILEDGEGGLKLAIQRVMKYQEKEKQKYIESKRSGGSKFVKSWFR